MTGNRALSILPTAAFATAALAAALLPARPAAARVVSRSAEISIGRETASQVEQFYKCDTDPAAVARVRQIGRRLVAAVPDAPYPFEFHVVEDATVNAFALPGGFVYVFRGLLQLVPNDDALASVLAHEISHVTQRHATRQFEKNLALTAILTGVLAGTGAGGGVGDAASVVQAVAGISFTR
ncbi:MAG TPA: M48 family metalloprotease, partial [Armatimonadota bacterium]|nr:M48 family metalloprotease [Armatimonadota bacterium]